MATRVASVAFALSLLAATAVAETPALEETYEGQRVARAMDDLGLQLHDSPEGRPIEYVQLVTADVFADDEFWPDLPPTFRNWRVQPRRHHFTVFNHFHALTEGDVIRRELLLEQGGVYREVTAEESMRNLRGLGIFALVRIVAVRIPGKESVGVLVYTRDLWSLRLETNFQGTSTNYQLGAQLVERNLFGRNKQATLRTELRLDTLSVGEVYFDYRLLGGTLQLSESFDLFLNRQTNEPEGGVGEVYVGKPFYTLAQRWAFDASARHLRHIVRSHDGQGEVLVTDFTDTSTRDGSDCDPLQSGCVRSVYAERSTSATLAGHYRRGQSWLHTHTLGMGLSDRDSEANDETALDPADRDDFAEAVLPVVRTQVYPFVRYRISTPDYSVFHNLATYGQSETLRLGPWTDLSLGVPVAALGSTDNAVFSTAAVGYRQRVGRGLVDLLGSGSGRLEQGDVIDQLLIGQLRGATPPWLLGRLVFFGRWEARRHDSTRTRVFLDGSSGLRGYPVGSFLTGGSRVLGTLEYRTNPLQLESVQLGGVLFCDTGSLYRRLSDIALRSSVGAGIRALFPQLNRYVFRLDAGLPTDGSGFAVLASFGVGQAVALTPAEDLMKSRDIRGR